MPDPITAAPPASQQAPAFVDPNAEPPANGGQQQQVTESWATGWLAKDGSFDHKAFDKAPDDLKPLAKDVGRYKGLDDLLRAFKERGELAGKKGLFEPLDPKAGDKEKAERMEAVRKINGTPAKPEEFALTRPEGLPEQYWDEAHAQGIAKIMYEEGASPSLAKRLLEAAATQTNVRLAAQQKEQTAILEEQDRLIRETLVKEGFDFPKGLEDAQRACRKFGFDPNSPFLKNASIFMALSRVGRSVKEDSIIQGATDGFEGGNNLSNDQAKAQAESITHDAKNPLYAAYWNKNEKGQHVEHKDHDKVVKRVNELWAMAVKGKPDRQRATR